MRISALLLAGLVVLTLTGCQPDDPIVVPQPEPSSIPLFASEEEALAAAEEAFGSYLAVADLIFSEGGQNPDRHEEVATGVALRDDLIGFANYASEGRYSEGVTTFDSASLQSSDLSGYAVTAVITMYACEDFGSVQVFDSTGAQVSDPARRTRWPVTVIFDLGDNSQLLVSEVEQWTGEDFCAI